MKSLRATCVRTLAGEQASGRTPLPEHSFEVQKSISINYEAQGDGGGEEEEKDEEQKRCNSLQKYAGGACTWAMG